METKGGGPAYPLKDEDGAGGYVQHFGISIRDYMAAAALTGLISCEKTSLESDTEFAIDSYAYADAMLAAREGK